MDFARKQLEKYGWTNGKGLGKQENGITEAIKPKLKRSVAGIGHDAASEFTEHWWKVLYDKAAQNVEIQEENGAPKRFKAKEEFEITNSTWKLSRKSKLQRDENPEYFDNFVKKAVLTSGGTKLEATSSASDDEEETGEKNNVFNMNMTDEELFAACGGRTAHKGARHGLKATGKLARIEQQEQKLLTNSKFAGYSKKTSKNNCKNLQIEELTLNSDSEKKEKKKKKKYCIKSPNNDLTDVNNEINESNKPQETIDTIKTKKNKKKYDKELILDSNNIEETGTSSCIDNDNCNVNNDNVSNDIDTAVEVSKKKKRAKHNYNDNNAIETSVGLVSKKKKRAKHNDIDNDKNDIETLVSKKKKRSKNSDTYQ